jgi:CheY-specific phosphatase CheX
MNTNPVKPKEIVLSEVEKLLYSAISTVFKTMLDLQVSFEPVNDQVFGDQAHVAGAVGVAGTLDAMTYLYADELMAREITGKLLGLPVESIDDESMVNDAFGELTNMVAGHLKSYFSDRVKACTMTIPTVVRGRDFRIEAVAGTKRLALCFCCHQHHMRAEIVIKSP